MFRAKWFYRPKDIGNPERDEIQFSRNEIFYSDHADCHNMNTIISRCDILPRTEQDLAFDEHMYDKDNSLFICRYSYESMTGTNTLKWLKFV
jgi:hypothetical protein